MLVQTENPGSGMDLHGTPLVHQVQLDLVGQVEVVGHQVKVDLMALQVLLELPV